MAGNSSKKKLTSKENNTFTPNKKKYLVSFLIIILDPWTKYIGPMKKLLPYQKNLEPLSSFVLFINFLDTHNKVV